MGALSKRSTVYFDPSLHQALRLKAAATQSSLSVLVDEAVRLLLHEDQQDLEVAESRANEPKISFKALHDDLKKHGNV